MIFPYHTERPKENSKDEDYECIEFEIKPVDHLYYCLLYTLSCGLKCVLNSIIL